MQSPEIAAPRGGNRWFGIRKLHLSAWLTVLAFSFCVFTCSHSEAQPNTKNVLVLFSTVYRSQEFLDVVEPAMRARVAAPITFYNAYLDYSQAQETDYRESMAGILRRSYADVKMDLVIVFHAPALDFAEEYRDRIFPGIPIVFIGLGMNDLEGQKVWPAVTGVVSPLGFRETIDLALRVQPDTNAVAVVEDATNLDSHWLAALHSAIARHQDKVREIDILGPPDRQLLARVSALPPHTVVIFQLFPDLSNQQAFGALELASEIANRLPTYAVFPSLCVNGCIGGAFEDHIKEWLLTGDPRLTIAVRRAPRRRSHRVCNRSSTYSGLAGTAEVAYSGIGIACG